MDTTIADLNKQLSDWVALKEKNGIKQHDDAWNKVMTLGGSSIATIQGINPYSTLNKMIGEKINIYKFTSGNAIYWGNLFEDVIKRYIEHVHDCKVLGEDLFIEGEYGCHYSPDGLAVMPNEKKIILMEFKCPYTRIPATKPPKQYVAQVKMGLDIIQIAAAGLLIEAVFRRCTWAQMGLNTEFDAGLGQKAAASAPGVHAYGIIGFYFDKSQYRSAIKNYTQNDSGDPFMQNNELIALYDELMSAYCARYVAPGNKINQYETNDLGDCEEYLFGLIMKAYDKKILSIWYGNIITEASDNAVDEDMCAFTTYCSLNDFTNFGILPWKLFRVVYHNIEREKDYLYPWRNKLIEVYELIKKCNDPQNESNKHDIFTTYTSTAKLYADYNPHDGFC